MTLSQVEGANAPSKTLKTQKIENINRFPIAFELQLDEPLDFSKSYSYLISAEVFSQKGDRKTVGDLSTETVNELKPNQTFITLEATALESCSADNAGGFCL